MEAESARHCLTEFSQQSMAAVIVKAYSGSSLSLKIGDYIKISSWAWKHMWRKIYVVVYIIY